MPTASPAFSFRKRKLACFPGVVAIALAMILASCGRKEEETGVPAANVGTAVTTDTITTSAGSAPATATPKGTSASLPTIATASITRARQPRKKGERIPIAILMDNTVAPMRNYQVALLDRLIRTRPLMDVLSYDAGGDPELQATQVRQVVSKGAAFLVVLPVDATTLAPVLREALKAGTEVAVLSPDVPDDACTFAVYTDERRLGKLAGEFITQALKSKSADEGKPATVGRVVQLRGDEFGTVAAQRSEGLVQAIQQEPGIVLVHDAPSNWSDTNAAVRIQEAMRIQKTFDIIYAHDDLSAAGAAKSLRDADVAFRESVLILGTDAVPGTAGGVNLITKGVLDATIYNPPLVDLAWKEIDLMLDSPAHVPQKRRQIRPIIITSANAPDFLRQPLPAPVVE